MRSLAFPAGVRPWNDADLASLTSRFGWLQSRISELSLDNDRLKRELERGAAKSGTAGPSASVYRRARRVVGRPIRDAQDPLFGHDVALPVRRVEPL